MNPLRRLASDIHAENRKAAFRRVFRRRAMWLLAAPVLLALVAFAFATLIAAQQFSPQTLTGGWKATGLVSYAYLVVVFLYCPAYLVGVLWFFWGTSARETDVRSRLLVMPVVAACFVWCPVMLMSSLSIEQRIFGFLSLVPIALIAGLCWSFIVRWLVGLSLRNHPAMG